MIVAHDLGTSSNKASLHTLDGNIVASVAIGYDTRYMPGGVVEQDPEDWWRAVGEATRAVVAKAGVRPDQVTGLAMSGQMMGAVLIDEQHHPVRPALIWADHRSTVQADRLEAAVGQSAAYRQLGHRIHPTYTLAKLMWVRDHEPEQWARTHRVCVAKDYVAARLVGRLATEPSDASGTDAFDQTTGEWSTTLLAAAEIDADMFPPLIESTTVLGGLDRTASEHTGLAVDTPVVLGGGDGPMAAVGVGMVAPDDPPYVSLGSSSWVSACTPTPLHDPLMRSMTFNHIVPEQFVPTATMQAGGASVAWIAEVLDIADRDLPAAMAAAAEVSAADDGLFFLPYLLGERSPHWNAAASGSFIGLRRHHEDTHLLRAVLEGVGFNLATCIEAFTDNGIEIDQVEAIGGGARSDDWLRILADIWQIPVRRRSIDAEANSLGAAVTGAVGLGAVDDFSIARTLSTVTGVFEPDPNVADRRSELHQRFTDAYQRLEPWFDQPDRGDS